MIDVTPKTKESIAYKNLKALILEGKLPKGEFLSQRMLAEKVDTNISTVRSVLRLLESDDLIENVPQWGVRIPLETEEIIRDRYFIRELLEVGAVKQIIKNRNLPGFDKNSIIEKARLCDQIAKEIPKEIEKFSKAHFEFHIEIAKQSGSPLLLQSLSRLHFKSLIISHAQRGWAYGSLIDHSKLVDVLLNGDEKSAVKETINHIRGGLESEIKTLREEKI